MKNMYKLLSVMAVFSILLSGCGIFGGGKASKLDKMEVNSRQDSASYFLGNDIMKKMAKDTRLFINDTMLVKGAMDALFGDSKIKEPGKWEEVFRRYQDEQREKQERSREQEQRKKQETIEQKAKRKAEENLKKSRKFLAENKQKDGVKTTESGMQYKVLEKGAGPKPNLDDSITVHYKGELIDGTVFDNSWKRGQPSTFYLNDLIEGWKEGLRLMRKGAKYKLFIPPELGYGKSGQGRQIGPNEALIFTVELININDIN